jgi:mannosyltransferase OCH1-like enzyme
MNFVNKSKTLNNTSKNKNIRPKYTFRVKDSYNSIIPLKIYQTWHTKEMPRHMRENVELLKRTNPRFEYFLFDDNDCREFIKTHFRPDVLNAYDNLIPGAYKADLWRYCVLYVNGGVYLDIKFKCVNGFKLIALTEKEHFPTDVAMNEYSIGENESVYNGFMMSMPNNTILLNAIYQIVTNVNLKYYGKSPLSPTGPNMLGNFFPTDHKQQSIVRRYVGSQGNGISIQNIIIIDTYPEYREEQKLSQVHYNILWKNKNIYY